MAESPLPPLIKPTQKPQKILIVGGCYAGLSAAVNLLDLAEGRPVRFAPTTEYLKQPVPVEVTIIDERDGYYHLIGSPLALASSAYAEKIWIKFSDVPGLKHPALKFVHGSVLKVDFNNKNATVQPHGEQSEIIEHYDYMIAASGLRRVWPVVPQSLTRDEYLLESKTHINQVRSAKNGVIVIGGGAVGIEMAAELKAVEPDIKVTLIHSRDHLLSSEPLPDDFKVENLSVLHEQGVETIMGRRVKSTSGKDSEGNIILTLSDDSTVVASHVINAISKSALTTSYLPSSVLDEQGYVKIRSSLHIKTGDSAEEYHFAAGDIALWSGIKRCGAAMHMGCYTAINIHQHIASKLPASRPTSPYASRASDSFNDIPVSEGSKPIYKELAEFPPMIGIAIGTSGTVYSPLEGTKSGREVLKYMFGEDLGFTNCYNYMKLQEAPPSLVEETKAAPTDLITGSIVQDNEKDESQSITPPLSATSAASPEVEPQTPVDAVGNAGVTNFEVLERIISGEGNSNEEVQKVASSFADQSLSKRPLLDDIQEVSNESRT